MFRGLGAVGLGALCVRGFEVVVTGSWEALA